MATLQVTNLQNTAATVTNVSLLADGTTTLVLNSTGTARTGGIRYNAGSLEVYTSGGVWAPIGGGGGGVSSVTASAPLVSSGGATPNVTATLATAAQAAAGTSNVVLSTPEFSVPKDASGMTGAAILPSGTDLQRAAIASPVVGMTRFNTDSGYEEVYTGATKGWRSLDFLYVPDPLPADLTISANTTLSGVINCNNFTVNAGVTLTVGSQSLIIYCAGTATINGTVNANGAGPVGGPPTFNSVSSGSLTVNGAYGVGPGQSRRTYNPSDFLPGSGGNSAGLELGGGFGAGSGGTNGGGTGGGGFVVRAAGNITVSATGVITANGTSGGSTVGGSSGFYVIPGSGGGSGGAVILHSDKNITMAGSISVQGGSGGAGTTTYSSNPAVGGGGGGGGGFIILQAGGTLSNTGTTSLTGGGGGTTNNIATGFGLSGSPGASYGGAGGGGGGSGVNATAGAAGQYLTSGSPF
jgi:hypothetical protein